MFGVHSGSGGLTFNLASGPLTLWCERLTQAILRKQGKEAALYADPKQILKTLEANDVLAIRQPAFEAYCTRYEKGPYKWGSNATVKNVIVPIFKILQEKCQPSPQLNLIVNYAIQAVNGWIELYRSCEASCCNWMISGLVALLSFLANSGLEADQQQQNLADILIDDNDDRDEEARGIGTPSSSTVGTSGGGGDASQQTANQQNVLNTIRQHIGKFRGDDNRQAGYVVLLSESIQACMMLGNIQMAAAFLKTVESSTLNVSQIPIGPLVSFKYHLGKLYMQQEKFTKAEDALAWAFSACQPGRRDLKRRITQCLTAVRLRMGKLPPERLLKRFELDHYLEIVRAMKSGNILRFEKVLFEKTAQFVREGTLLCVEKLKFIVYRTLIKKTLDWAERYLNFGETRNIIPLELFTAAFRWQLSDDFIEFDDEEMACVMANLIKLGYVKGYIAWEHRKVVFSKILSVPPLRSVQLS